MKPSQLFAGPLRFLPSLIVVALLAYLTLHPDPVPPKPLFYWEGIDKMVHALMFGGLTVVLLSDSFRGRRINPFAWILIVLVGMAAGAIIELLQREMGLGRTADRNDFIADAMGVLFASLAWLIGRFSHK